MVVRKKVTDPLFMLDTNIGHATWFAAGATQHGTDGENTLSGGRGHDWLYGGAGNDNLAGNGGNDVLEGGAGEDTLFGGNGIDTVSYLSSPVDDPATGAGVTIDLDNHSGSGADAEGDQIWEIENIVGSDFADYLGGDGGENFIDGAGRSDVIFGRGGNDYLAGGDGNDDLNCGTGDDVAWGGDGDDTAYGEFGNDRLYGGDGADNLYGNQGDDVIVGGAGLDQLNGGDGADTFVFYAHNLDGLDVIQDFDKTSDILRLVGVVDANDWQDASVTTNFTGDVEIIFSGGGGVVIEDAGLGVVTTLAQLDAQINIEYVA